MAASFKRVFSTTDRDFLAAARSEQWGDGTTVCAALLHGNTLHIANVGDTRAVLATTGEAAAAGATGVATSVSTNWGGGGGGGVGAELAVRLSVDHKPNLPEEAARVRAMGGDVRCVQGCWRVMRPGAATMLAVSRALGDCVLKPVVSCVPFTASRTLSPRDRFVLIASDGVWDVIDDDQVYSHMK